MHLFFILRESDLLWPNTASLHWQASRVNQIRCSRLAAPLVTDTLCACWDCCLPSHVWQGMDKVCMVETEWAEVRGARRFVESGVYEGHPPSSTVCWALNRDGDPTSVRVHGDFAAASTQLSNDHMQGTRLGLVTRCHSCWYGQVKLLIAVERTLNTGARQHKCDYYCDRRETRHHKYRVPRERNFKNEEKSVLLGFVHGKDI